MSRKDNPNKEYSPDTVSIQYSRDEGNNTVRWSRTANEGLFVNSKDYSASNNRIQKTLTYVIKRKD